MADILERFNEYRQRLKIQDILADAGYVHNKRDGSRWPAYVRVDSDGRRVRGDKFLVSQGGYCCCQPPVMKSYNIISFIKEHPQFFAEYTPGMNLNDLVDQVCSRLLNMPIEKREYTHNETMRTTKSFKLEDYTLQTFDTNVENCHRPFYPYFKHRGIDLTTQYAFHKDIMLAARGNVSNGDVNYKNLVFPLTVPGKPDSIVGFEERGRLRRNGESPYKGKAAGSNASEGLWIASPDGTRLENAERVLLFESGYDAMAYFQLHRKKDKELRKAVFVSTGGTPTVSQMTGIVRNAPSAAFHLCFDNDEAGRQFVHNFEQIIKKEKAYSEKAKDFLECQGNIEVDERKGELFSLLPENVKQQHFDSFKLFEEYREAPLCPDEKQAVWQEYLDGMAKFDKMVKDCIANVVREVPQEGFKDWNEELLDELDNTTKKAVGTDIDGDGMLETGESHEEKHHYRR